jgi:hypothetical protein
MRSEQFQCDVCMRRGAHFTKNCRKFAPEVFDEKRADWWYPNYEVGDVSFRLDDISSNECPVSVILPESRMLVQLLGRNDTVHRAAGAAMFGLDASTWPAWWCDAVALAQQVVDMEDAAIAAERRKRT